MAMMDKTIRLTPAPTAGGVHPSLLHGAIGNRYFDFVTYRCLNKL
jgi:hypothetical protein